MCYSGTCLQPELHQKQMVVTLGMGGPKKINPWGGGYESTNRHLWGSNHLASSPARLTSSSREIGRLQQNLPVKINNHPRCRNLSINSMLHYFLLKTHIWLISTTVYYVSISFLERTLCAHMSKSQKKNGKHFSQGFLRASVVSMSMGKARDPLSQPHTLQSQYPPGN